MPKASEKIKKLLHQAWGELARDPGEALDLDTAAWFERRLDAIAEKITSEARARTRKG